MSLILKTYSYPRVIQIQTKTNKWDLIKLKTFSQQRKLQKGRKDNHQNGRKYLQMKQLTKD